MTRLALLLLALAGAVVALVALVAIKGDPVPMDSAGPRAAEQPAAPAGGAGEGPAEAALEAVGGEVAREDGLARETEASADRDPTIPPGRARLVVELVSGSRGLGGCQVRFPDRDAAELEVRGRGGRVGVTDEDGRVPFLVTPEVTLALEVAPLGTSDFERWSTNTPREGTTKTFVVQVPLRETRPYALRIVDRGTGEAISGATALVEFHDLSRTKLERRTDASGDVLLQLPMNGNLFVSAEGYSPRSFLIDPEGPTRTGRLCLSRTGQLTGVIPPSLQGESLEIRALGVNMEGESVVRDLGWPAEGRDKPPVRGPDEKPSNHQYRGTVGDDGRWRIDGLVVAPHAARLRITHVALIGRQEACVLASDLTLAAGEHREIQVDEDVRPTRTVWQSLRSLTGKPIMNSKLRAVGENPFAVLDR